jgi:hypothetical protein
MRTHIIAIVLFAVLLGGCISTEVSHRQHADGSADVSQSTDLSILKSYGSSYGSSSSYSSALGNVFDKLCEQYEQGVECEEEDGVMTLTKSYTTADSFYKFEVKDELFVKKYRLTVDQLPDFSQYAKKSSSIFGDEYDYGSPYAGSAGSSYGSSYGSYGDYLTSKEGLKLSSTKAKSTGTVLKQVGMEYTYRVQMPGRITDAPGALEFNDSEATFDVVQQLQDRKPIVVVSEEVNWLGVGIIGAMGVFVILSVAIAAILMLKPKQVS